MNWRHEAACAAADPELFFPHKSKGPMATQVAAATAVCGRCPVATQCLNWAVQAGQSEGIWGGVC